MVPPRGTMMDGGGAGVPAILARSRVGARVAWIERTFVGDATTRPRDLPKVMARALSDEVTRAVPEIVRIAGRLETEERGPRSAPG